MLACTTCTSKKTLALLCTGCSGTDNLTGHKYYVQNGKLFGIFKKLVFIFNFWTITNCAKNFEINVWEQLQWVPEYFFFSPLSQEHLLKHFWELTQRALTSPHYGPFRPFLGHAPHQKVCAHKGTPAWKNSTKKCICLRSSWSEPLVGCQMSKLLKSFQSRSNYLTNWFIVLLYTSS